MNAKPENKSVKSRDFTMLKVLHICDKEGTAIDRLAQGLKPYHDSFQFDVISVHPKRPDSEQLEEFERLGKEADIIDWGYFRTAQLLREKYPWVKEKPQILNHYNPYSIHESDWNEYDIVTADNQSIYQDLSQITQARLEYIPLTTDTDFWTFERDWKPFRQVLMVANRIESKKGVLPVAKACQKLNIPLILVGSISSGDYFQEVMSTGVVTFHQQISDESLRKLYYQSAVHVCNSVDNFESGTLPILEAMLCGTPVITREVGHVPELNNGQNMVINTSTPDDIDNLGKLIGELIDNPVRRREIRDKAWNTAKTRSNERRAVMFQRLYRSLLSDQPPVSVIVPVYDSEDVIKACLEAIKNQDYPNLELVVCDDNPSVENSGEMVEEFAKIVNFPVKYIGSGLSDYGLARARNLGIVYSTGDILVFCDQRQIMKPDAVSQFVAKLEPNSWLWGSKGFKKDWVENFSCTYRQTALDCGMFCERIDEYGGLTQEIRSRIRTQGIKTIYVEEAQAEPMGKSSNRATKKAEIVRMKNRLWRMNRD